MDYRKLISNGKSVREFKEEEIKEEYLKEIREYFKKSKRLIPEIELEIKIFNQREAYEGLDKVAGYNGYMIKAPSYLIILSQVKEEYIKNSGYTGENLILKARDLGVDSCWVTFEDSNLIKEKLNIVSDKEVTTIIALGYALNSKVKLNNESSNRVGIREMVYMDEWGANANIDTLEERGLLDAFGYARMAPSTLNRQPWRFIIDGGKVILTVRKDEFASDYEGNIDTGIAMLYFGLIIDITMFDSKWSFDKLEKDYKVPQDYEIVGYCNI